MSKLVDSRSAGERLCPLNKMSNLPITTKCNRHSSTPRTMPRKWQSQSINGGTNRHRLLFQRSQPYGARSLNDGSRRRIINFPFSPCQTRRTLLLPLPGGNARSSRRLRTPCAKPSSAEPRKGLYCWCWLEGGPFPLKCMRWNPL